MLTDEPFVLAIPDGSDLAGDGSVSVRALANVPLVMFSAGLAPGFAESLGEF